MGAINVGPDWIREVQTPNTHCELKKISACRIGANLCGVRLDYYNCNFVRARTEACTDNKQVN